MGYCTYGGKVVPGNNQAGCVGGGGNWVEDQPAMNINPNEQARLVAERQMQEWEGGGLTSELIPGESLISDGLIAGSNAIGLPPEAGLIAGGLFTKNPKQIVKGFTGTPNTIKQVKKPFQGPMQPKPFQGPVKPQPFQGPPQQKLTDIGRIGDVTPTKLQSLDNAVYRAGQYVGQNPIKATATAAGVGVPAYNMFNSGEPVTDKKVVQNTIANQASPMVNVEQRNARDKAIMQAQNAGNTEGVNALLAGGNPTGTDTQLFGGGQKNSMGQMGGASSVSFTEGLFNTGNTLKKDAQTGTPSKSLMDNIQSKDWWMTPTEGGSGKWDNRLFRLGEMMTHMGTPLSKQGKNPAERWTTASATSNKAATAAAAAKAKLDKENKPADIFSKIGNKTEVNALTEKVAGAMGKDKWFAFDPEEADVTATANEAVIAIRGMLSKVNPMTGKTYTYREAEATVLSSIK